MVELHEIRVFLALAEELHFGRTARRIGLTQSRVSQLLRTLELKLGQQLVDRTSRRVHLTAAGGRFRDDVGPAYDQFVRSLVDLAADDDPASYEWRTRLLRIDVWGDVGAPRRLVSRLSGEIPQLIPELSMRQSASAAITALLRQDIDVAFGRPYDLEQALPTDLRLQPFYLEPLSVALSSAHPRADAEFLTPDDLQRFGLWWPLENSPAELVGLALHYARHFEIPLTTSGLIFACDDFLRPLKADAERVAFFGSEWRLPPASGLRVVPLRPVPCFLWWAISRKGDHHPLLTEFLELIEEVGRGEGWLAYDPDRHWLPDRDAAALLAGHVSTS